MNTSEFAEKMDALRESHALAMKAADESKARSDALIAEIKGMSADFEFEEPDFYREPLSLAKRGVLSLCWAYMGWGTYPHG